MRVIVLDGNENQAVAATRSLDRAGYEVTVGASESWSKAGWSRCASKSFVYPSPRTDPDAFVRRLVEEIRSGNRAIVMPMTERTTIPLSARRADIAKAGGMMVLPPEDVLLKVFDKRWMTELAQTLGIAVPRTWVVQRDADASRLAPELPYPVVLKPLVSEERNANGGSTHTGTPLYARSAREFLEAVAQMLGRCSAVLVQEFVQGTGAGYFAILRHGELRGEFAHRRLRDVRPTGSGSALRESALPSPTLREASLALLRAVGWHGVAMVEYRMRADGTPVFLEVNGRFWHSLALAVHAGVDFPLGLARLAEHGDLEPLPAGRPGVRCRWLLGDARHLAAVWRGAPAGYPGEFPSRLGTLLAELRPSLGMTHDNFELADPLPELGDWIHFFAHKSPGVIKGKLGGGARG